jgi:hypothetical protein
LCEIHFHGSAASELFSAAVMSAKLYKTTKSGWMEIKIARCEKATPLNIHHGKSNLLLQKTAGANDGAALRYYFIIIISASAENVRAAHPVSQPFHILEIPYREKHAVFISRRTFVHHSD